MQVHVLNTLFVLLEALLPCMQKSEDEHPIKKAVTADKKKKLVVERDEDEDDEDVSDEEEKEEIVEQQDDPKKNDFEQTYIFSLLWAVGGYLENAERQISVEWFKCKLTCGQDQTGDPPEGQISSSDAKDCEG